LMSRGFNQTQTVLIIYAWCIALAVGGYTVRWSAGPVKWVAFISLFAVTGIMAHWLGLFQAVKPPSDDVSSANRNEDATVRPKST